MDVLDTVPGAVVMIAAVFVVPMAGTAALYMAIGLPIALVARLREPSPPPLILPPSRGKLRALRPLPPLKPLRPMRGGR